MVSNESIRALAYRAKLGLGLIRNSFGSLYNKEAISSCIECLSNNRTIKLTSLSYSEVIRPKGIIQTLNLGIWSIMLPKSSMLLWRIKSKSLNILTRLQGRRINLQTICPLCEREEETMQRLFFNCPYSRNLLLKVINSLNNSIGQIVDKPPSPMIDIRVGDIMEIIEKFIHKASCWGIHWLALGSLSWHI